MEIRPSPQKEPKPQSTSHRHESRGCSDLVRSGDITTRVLRPGILLSVLHLFQTICIPLCASSIPCHILVSPLRLKYHGAANADDEQGHFHPQAGIIRHLPGSDDGPWRWCTRNRLSPIPSLIITQGEADIALTPSGWPSRCQKELPGCRRKARCRTATADQIEPPPSTARCRTVPVNRALRAISNAMNTKESQAR